MASEQRDTARREIDRVFNVGPVAGLADGQLLDQFVARRDEVAFEALLALHGPMVLGVCRRHLRDSHEVEDAFQATFLVLVRRAGVLREVDQLGPWLHGVALRVAVRARTVAARRREGTPGGARSEAAPHDAGLERKELGRALDEEIGRLPEKYRRPVVLCYLEGRTHAEAARRLRSTEGSVRGRLDRARQRLQSRLTRRGLAPAVGLPAAWLTPETAPASVPPTLLAATRDLLVNVARLGALSTSAAPVVTLAERTLRMMMLSKLKLVAASLLAVAVVTLIARASVTPDLGGQPAAADARQASAGQAGNRKAITDEAPEARRSGRTLQIQVVDRRSSQPLPGVVLRIGIDNARSDAKTDDAGRYAIREIPRELKSHVVFWAKKEGFVPVTVSWDADAASHRLPGVYTLTMEPGTTIGGVVRDEDGRPIAGATVYLRADCGRGEGAAVPDLFEYPVKTDTQGRWRCDLVPADSDCVSTRLVHPDFVSDQNYGDTPVPPRDQLRAQTSVMRMMRGAMLVGTVRDAAGRPVAGARVKLGIDRFGSPQPPSTTTDAQGKYRFQVQPGSHVVTVQAWGHAPDLKHLPAVRGRDEVDFQLKPARTIQARVVDRDGRPVAGVRVVPDTWRGYRTLEGRVESDGDGRFRWTDAPDDEVLMDLLHEGYMPIRRRPLKATETEVTITLAPPLRIHGSVVDAATGQPIASFKVVPGIVISNPEPHWMYDRAKTAEEGRYEITFDDARTPHIRIEAKGYRPAVSRAFRADEGEQVYDVSLHKGEAIAGVVRLPDGSALPGAEVLLVVRGREPTINSGRITQRGQSPIAVTDADGHFMLPTPEGDCAINVVHDRGFAERSSRDLAINPAVTVHPWGRIEGTLRVGSKPGARQSIGGDRRFPPPGTNASANFLHHAETDDEGRFVLDRIPPGEFYVGLTLMEPRGLSTTSGTAEYVEIHPGETRRVELGGTGRPVVGRVAVPAASDRKVDWSYARSHFTREGPRLAPPEGLSREEQTRWWRESDAARASRQVSRHFPFNVGPDGSFRVDDVPAGTYTLWVQVFEPPSGNQRNSRPVLGMATRKFVVPEMPGRRSDDPLDLGAIELKGQPRVGDRFP